jgi:hypothetical protein
LDYFRRAEEIVGAVFKAVETGLGNELVAAGVAPVEEAPKSDKAEESWS